jgi:phosphomethylpyrimidine synthase
MQGALTQAMRRLTSSQRNPAGRDAAALECQGILETSYKGDTEPLAPEDAAFSLRARSDMTQLIEASEARLTRQMHEVAGTEGIPVEQVCEGVASGRIVVPANRHRDRKAVGIGADLFTKVNSNIGTSPSHHNLDEELGKLKVSVDAGAHSVMDLSTGGDLRAIRRAILNESPVMVGTVPIYAVASQLQQQGESILSMTPDMLFDEIAVQCEEGVDFITVHCGVTRQALERLAKTPRIAGMVSRGGSMLARWMGHHGRENPLYEEYDRLLELCREHDVTLSLGDGLRPGSIHDASDAAQLDELVTLGELAKRAHGAGVQAMIEGPGHVPLDQVAEHMRLQKILCHGAPFYVLGPLVTDIAAGYDHIAAAIGGAVAAMSGADFLCYVTAAEHLRLPTIEEVREGVVATRLAAHAGDVVKLGKRASERDREMSIARRKLDWDGMFAHALDPVMARHKRLHSEDAGRDVCTMCGDLCAVKTFEAYQDAREILP